MPINSLENLTISIPPNSLDLVMEVSSEVKHVFITPYLQYVWREIRGLGIDTEPLGKRLWDDYAKSGKTVSENLYFLQWGIDVLNPILNQKLDRPLEHPTFAKMMEYLMQPFIAKDPFLNRIKLNEKHMSIEWNSK